MRTHHVTREEARDIERARREGYRSWFHNAESQENPYCGYLADAWEEGREEAAQDDGDEVFDGDVIGG